jgi:signal transduction histidine kinase
MLIEQVFDLAKYEVGTLEVSRERTSLSSVIEESIAMLTPTAESAGVVLAARGADTLPELDGDAVKLKQVFINLIGNAIKFTPAGGRVAIACDADGDVARVRVADTGIGMREEDIPLVLQPFYRLASAFNARYQGAGLGLPLAKAIVDLHGGALAIETRPGMGTTVTVTLPLAAPCASKSVEAA